MSESNVPETALNLLERPLIADVAHDLMSRGFARVLGRWQNCGHAWNYALAVFAEASLTDPLHDGMPDLQVVANSRFRRQKCVNDHFKLCTSTSVFRSQGKYQSTSLALRLCSETRKRMDRVPSRGLFRSEGCWPTRLGLTGRSLPSDYVRPRRSTGR